MRRDVEGFQNKIEQELLFHPRGLEGAGDRRRDPAHFVQLLPRENAHREQALEDKATCQFPSFLSSLKLLPGDVSLLHQSFA